MYQHGVGQAIPMQIARQDNPMVFSAIRIGEGVVIDMNPKACIKQEGAFELAALDLLICKFTHGLAILLAQPAALYCVTSGCVAVLLSKVKMFTQLDPVSAV